MATMQEILNKYVTLHNNVSRQFYIDKTLDMATFITLHIKCWNDMQQELIDNAFIKRQWRYVIGATISTALGDINVEVTINSPIELTVAQVQNNIDKLKTANWTLKSKEIFFVVG